MFKLIRKLRAIEHYKELKKADFIDDIEEGISICVNDRTTRMLNQYAMDTVYPGDDLFFVRESEGKIKVEYVVDDSEEITFLNLDELGN